jgi:hypothetical protein
MTVYGLQFDSIEPLPFAPAIQAHYVNGPVSKWPGAVTYGRGWVWIDATGADPAAAFWRDIEQGDGTPADFPGWLDQRHAAGQGWGGGYCDRSNLPAMISAAGDRPWSLWLGTLDGTIPTAASLSLPPAVTLVAVQAYSAAMIGGVTADVSVVVDQAYWDGRRA